MISFHNLDRSIYKLYSSLCLMVYLLILLFAALFGSDRI